MGMFTLRSLLLAAIVICNCITWTASRHHYMHNVNGHRSRHRRQGAGLYLSASYVIPGGEGAGAWGEWGEVSPCSRTCGGGVASQKRICLEVSSDGQPSCSGGDTKYFSCQTQDCPEGSRDFRAEQCASYDNKLFRGEKYSWVPYTKAPNPCELNCMPRAERFYYRQQRKVVDGTRCTDDSFDVCVDGTCQPVGCDMMLGSKAREDKCRQCRGNGTNCRTVTGLFDSQDLQKGYNDILLIPEGATNIAIAEVRASNNYLALRAKQDQLYYLNGEYHIDFPRSLMIAGTLWHYERSQQGLPAPDKLRCLGPTNETLYLSILLLDDNVGIEYEYSVPTAFAPPSNQQYNWVHGEYSECSATCGGGFQTRQVQCRSRDDLELVDDSLCDEGLRPVTNQTCNTEACPPRWVEGQWSSCSKPCGEGGTRSRQVYCEKIITNGFPSMVADKECFDLLGPKPELFQTCNENATCPSWFTGPWKPCDKLCGEGKQTRQVVCYQKIKGRVEVYEDDECAEEKPATEQSCMLHPCDGVDWVLSDWSGCDSCLSTVRARIAQCATKDHRVVDSELCSYHPTPVLEEPCDRTKLPPCTVQWYATQWSNCSVECGKGIQTRRVFCGLFDGASVLKVDDERCEQLNKYNDTKECEVPKDKCPAKWFSAPWSECTTKCGGGVQYRRVMCLSGGKEVEGCNNDTIPDSAQSCNIGPCDKDEMIPVDAKSTPVMDDDYDDGECVDEEEEYPEVGAEVDSAVQEGSLSFEDFMFSDSPGTGETGSGATYEIESEFTTEPGSGSEPTISDTAETDYTSIGSSEGSDETTVTESTVTDNVTESTSPSSETEETETTITTLTEETSETGLSSSSTDGTTDTDITDLSSTSSSLGTDTSVTTEETTKLTSETESSEVGSSTTKTGSTESTNTGTTDTDITGTGTETTDTDITGTGTETTDTNTEMTETETTDTDTSGTGSTETTDLSTETTDTNTETIGTGSTELTDTESTDTESTETSNTATESTDTVSTESSDTTKESTETTDTITEITGTGSTETDSTVTETSDTNTETTGSESSETTDTNTESTGTGSMETTGTNTELTETGSTETTVAETTESTIDIASSSSTTESSETTAIITDTEQTTIETSTAESTISSSSAETDTTTEISTIAGSTTVSATDDNITETVTSESSSSSESTSESSTESSSETPTGSTETTSDVSSSESTDTTETSSLSSSETLVTSTESWSTSETSMSSTEEGSSTTEGSSSETTSTATEETVSPGGTTPWDWSSTVDIYTKKPRCKLRRKAKCIKSKFGCCPDKRTPAAGPFDEGCPNPTTCKESQFGCCPDGVSAASGPQGQGCPTAPCNETLFGCCQSDNVTAAEGNDQEGCPPPPPACRASKYGCCKDEKMAAEGANKEGCPETIQKPTAAPEDKDTEQTPSTTTIGDCSSSKYGCCYDNETDASGPNGEGCPCSISQFGCCPDGISTVGDNLEGCIMSCNTSAYGCCPDGETPAHGPDYEGCCLLYAFGCCPDNYKPAEGPHLEGCGCQHAHFGCCPDNATVARGPDNLGCGCQYTQHGCCPDRHTEAQGPEFEGCDCHTYQFGCCPDGVTISSGPDLQGCYCQQTKFGCCGDGTTAAQGPDMQGCDCSNSKYGCCPDGVTEAKGDKFLNCTDAPENRQAACALANDRGSCRNYSVSWYYDMTYGGCSRFWYGGCEGNGNRFVSQEECEDVCVRPPPKDACKLPMVKGACTGYYIRWYYDSTREQCSQFVFGGCLGNANNYDTKELCQQQCEPEKTEDQCNLPIERGSCAGSFARWGFNAAERRCEQFTWGGCEGNSNRYGSEAACLLRCDPPGAPQPACALPQDAGNCTQKQPAWSFSQTENRCVPFYYTGCGGNDNRFRSEETCAEACPSAYVQELCALPALTGECADYTERWFFDTSKRRCRPFYYGGCGGNENNFASEWECESRCTELVTTTVQPTQPDAYRSEYCFLEIDSGPCTQQSTRWAYSAARGACVGFEYGGCGGNRNNFPSLEYCEHYCAPTQDICQLPMLAGPCDQSEMKWFYDASSDSCSQFTYGGCQGNDNRFNSLGECERRCRTGAQEVATTTMTPATSSSTIAPEYIPAECRVSPALEQCAEAGRVWYLDLAQRACVPHDNAAAGLACRRAGAHASQEACERACGAFRDLDVCRYPVDAGPCSEAIPKVFFNAASGQCEPFTYGGCHGGPNRFSSVDECQRICKPETDPCKQPQEPGNCLAYLVKWYYDEVRNECGQFVYGGCNGNDNRFETQEECQGRCKKIATTESNLPTTVSAGLLVSNQVRNDECRTPDSLELCGDAVRVYYYDSRTQACLAADFGGCRHPNSYRTEEECERRCGAFRGLDVCGSVLDPGPCLNLVPKIYWDSASGRCTSFTYGGCHGGPNRFSTVDECEEVCGDMANEPSCALAVDSGLSCDFASRRWYYSEERVECLPFVYLGCGGNDNNFRSYEQCARRCKTPRLFEITDNEVVPEPDCSAFEAECAALRCEFGVQHTRAGGCERCACVRVEVDCSPLQQECAALQCTYGLERAVGDDGCERCRCVDHPCSSHACPADQRCVASVYRDPVSRETRYSAECRTVNKTGSCPADEGASTEGACRRECRDDADCAGAGKCCARACSSLCLPPAPASTPAPATTRAPTVWTTYGPDAPRAPQAARESEPAVTASEGGRATLRCLFHGNPPPQITWRRGEITIDGDVGRYRLLSDGALEIVSLYRNDSGVYICIADNGLGRAQQEIRLEVNDPTEGPAGIAGEQGARVTGELGRPLNVRCLAFGYPAPAIYWYRGRNGPMVPYSSQLYEARNNILQIRSLNLETLGEYICQAYNGKGKPADWSFVVQAYSSDGPSDNPYLVSREEVLVTPRTLATEPTTPTTPTTPPAIQVPVYTVPVSTRIAAAGTRVAAGAEINLPCEVDGYPVPEVRWTKDDVPLVTGDRLTVTDARLTVSRAVAADSGVYGCHANNAYSEHSSAVRITVEGLFIPPTCKDNPYFANCQLIVHSKFCHHKYYSKFCCKSCVEAGQLDPLELDMQADQPWYRRK